MAETLEPGLTTSPVSLIGQTSLGVSVPPHRTAAGSALPESISRVRPPVSTFTLFCI